MTSESSTQKIQERDIDYCKTKVVNSIIHCKRELNIKQLENTTVKTFNKNTR